MIRLSKVEYPSFQKTFLTDQGSLYIRKDSHFLRGRQQPNYQRNSHFRGATFATTKTFILLTIIQLNATTHHHSAPLCENDYLTLTKTEKSSNFVLANIQGYGIESHHPLDDIVN